MEDLKKKIEDYKAKLKESETSEGNWASLKRRFFKNQIEALDKQLKNKRANIGDTVRSKSNDPKGGYFRGEDGYDTFVVMKEEVDERGTQWVWRCVCPYPPEDPRSDECIFSPCSYGMPDTKFDIIKRKE